MCNSKKTKKEICKQNKTPKIKNIKVEKDKFDKLLSAMKNGKTGIFNKPLIRDELQ